MTFIAEIPEAKIAVSSPGRISTFFFPGESDRWLTALRVGLGLAVITDAWPLRMDWHDIFAGTERGLMSRELFEGLLSTQSPLVPRLGWLVWICQRLGSGESFALSLAWVVLLGAALCLLIGLYSRPAAVVAWALQLASAKSGGLFTYGADNFLTIGLFYLMIAPLPDRWSWDWRKRAPSPPDPQRLGFHRRVLQCHLCLIYFFSGLTKCLGVGWWNGENLWRALTSPPFDRLPIEFVASFSPLLPLAGISICLLEIAYAFLIWPAWSRRFVLGSVCVMHLAIGVVMGMYLFALIMLVLNIAAFGVSGSSSRQADDSSRVPTVAGGANGSTKSARVTNLP